MADDTQEAQAIAERLRSALEGRDLTTLAGILDPDVRWGGEEDTPQTCHNRADVLAWYGGVITVNDFIHADIAGDRIVQDTLYCLFQPLATYCFPLLPARAIMPHGQTKRRAPQELAPGSQ